MPLRPGDRAPDVRLPAHTLETVSLAEYGEGQPLVVLFFPLAFTGVCTTELCTIAEDWSAYRELGARVVAVSVDSPWALERFRKECGAEFPFLSDFNREATRAYGVLRTDPLGPGLREVADRAAFVVDPRGEIAYAWHSPDPGVLPPFEEIKEAVRSAAA